MFLERQTDNFPCPLEYKHEPLSTVVSKSIVDYKGIIPYEQKLEDYEMSALTKECNDILQSKLHLNLGDSEKLVVVCKSNCKSTVSMNGIYCEYHVVTIKFVINPHKAS